jgi:hypothetical protein
MKKGCIVKQNKQIHLITEPGFEPRTLSNDHIISKIREAKKQHIYNLSKKLQHENQNPKSWWSVLKSFIKPFYSISIPTPTSADNTIISDNVEKANFMNDVFVTQTRIDKSIAPRLPD